LSFQKQVQHWFSLTAKATQTQWFPLFTVRESQCWTSFQMTKTVEFGLLSQWAKANVGLVFEMMETIEFGLLSQWAKANVGLVPQYILSIYVLTSSDTHLYFFIRIYLYKILYQIHYIQTTYDKCTKMLFGSLPPLELWVSFSFEAYFYSNLRHTHTSGM
jgi:hypothetical protein